MRKKSSSSVRVFYPKFSRDEVIKVIGERLPDLKKELPLLLVVLFGSYAKGNYTVASDVDILVVYDGEERKDAYATVKRAIGIPGLEPHVYTAREYWQMRDTIDKMIEGGYTIYSKG